MHSEKTHMAGFTLIELMVTLAVAALLVGIAAPSFRDMTIRNRLVTHTNDFIATLNYARSEAIRRGQPVSICSSNDGEDCSGTWSDGWIVFVNVDNDNPAAVTDPDDEPIIKVSEGFGPNYALGADASVSTHITYGSDGAASNTGMFAICHDGKLEGSRGVVITPLRPRVAADTNDTDRIPNRDDGENMDSCNAPSGS